MILGRAGNRDPQRHQCLLYFELKIGMGQVWPELFAVRGYSLTETGAVVVGVISASERDDLIVSLVKVRYF